MNTYKYRKWSKNKWAGEKVRDDSRKQKVNIGNLRLVKVRNVLALQLLDEKRQKSSQQIRGLNG